MVAELVYRPRPPFLSWPRQWIFDGGFAWLTPSGPAIVVQTTVEVASDSTVHSLQDIFDDLLRERVMERLPGLSIIHDWRSLRKIGAAARRAWTERTKRPGMPYADLTPYVALGDAPMLRMALKSAAVAVQLAVGQHIAHFVDHPRDAMYEAGVLPPPEDFLREWLTGPVTTLPQVG